MQVKTLGEKYMDKKRIGIYYYAEIKRVFFYHMNKIFVDNYDKGLNTISMQEFINKYKKNYKLQPYDEDKLYISINEKSLKNNIKVNEETYILLNLRKQKHFFINWYESKAGNYDECLCFL